MFCDESITQHETNILEHLFNRIYYSTVVNIKQIDNQQALFLNLHCMYIGPLLVWQESNGPIQI